MRNYNKAKSTDNVEKTNCFHLQNYVMNKVLKWCSRSAKRKFPEFKDRLDWLGEIDHKFTRFGDLTNLIDDSNVDDKKQG